MAEPTFKIDSLFDENLGKQVWDHVYKLTGNANLTAGILGSLYKESRLDHKRVSNKGARGIAQLLGTKYKNYQNYLTKNKLQDNWQNQLTFVINHLKDANNDSWTKDYNRIASVRSLPVKVVNGKRRYVNEKGDWYPADEYDQAIKKYNPKWVDYSYEAYNNVDWNNTTPERAAEIYTNTFERASDSEVDMPTREGAARYFYTKYAKTKKFEDGGSIESSDINLKQIEINDNIYNVKVCDTDELRMEGLSNVSEMSASEGAIFLLDSPVKAADVTFTMEEMDFNLDIIFCDTNDTVVSVIHGKAWDIEPIIPDCDSNIEIAYVIELNANSGVNIGDEVDLEPEEASDEEVDKLYVLDENGKPQYELLAGARIFSRIHSKTLIKKAKKARRTKKDSDYKSLARYMFNCIEKQNSQEAEFVTLE